MDLIVPEVESVDTVLVINPDTRVINVGSSLLLGVETDNDAERIKFQCPKIVGDNLDLSQYHIYIHYQNAKGETGKYLCEDVEDVGENITFSWLLSQKVTVFKGATKFLVCAKKTDAETIVWNTTLASGNVLEGLDVDEDIVQQNDDVIEQILLRLERIEDINNAKVTFEESLERTNIESQETMSTIFGKIKKWFSDLKVVAFTGSYDDLLNKPTIPTKTSDLSNDNGYLTSVPSEYVTDTELEEKGFAKSSDIPSKLPNPYKLKFTGAVDDTYDGSAAKTINIPTGSGASDNIIYKDVAKQLNPNVTDSFQRAMWNLKMYGQSTQGADPSPTNPQEITAISEFEGAPTGGNLFNIDKVIGSGRLKNNGDGTLTVITSNTDSSASSGQKLSDMANLIVEKTYILNAKTTGTQKYIYLGKTDTVWEFGRSRKITQDDLDNIVRFYASGVNTQAIISEIQIELGETATPYTPYVSQPFTYTPTNPMYSTQDGSIADYVDVEKGVEVYQFKKVVFDGTNATFKRLNENNVYYTTTLSDGITPYTVSYEYYIWCDNLKVYKANNTIDAIINNSIIYGTSGGTSTVLFLKVDDIITTVEQLNTWLQSNPVTVVYVLATPTETPINEEQLQMLRSLYTYTGVTNFLCNAPVSFNYEISQQINRQNVENRLKALEAKLLLQGGN